MPRSSKHKSHKQSKHSYKEGKEYSESDEDVKMKERSSSKEESLARVSRDSGNLTSGEKRKLRDGKDLTSEDYASSKRRREKAEASGGGDRRNDGVDDRGIGRNVGKIIKGESGEIDQDNGSRLKEMKSLSDSKSRQQSSDDKKKDNIASLVEKEESKSGRVESKRKFEKDSARKESKDSKEVKEKERGADREKKGQEDCKGDADRDIVKRQGSQLGELVDEKQGKRGRETAEGSTPNDVHNPELKKETDRSSRKKKEDSGDQDNHGDDLNESDDRRLSSRCDRSKYEGQRDEKHKDESYEDNPPKDGDKDDRHKDDRYSEDVDKGRRRKDDKYREACDRDGRRKDDKYWENVDRDKRHMDDKYRDHGDRDNKDKHNKYQEDGERESRRRDDKNREDDRHRNDKHRGDGDKDGRYNENRYHEDGESDDRQRYNKYREYNERDGRSKEEKHRGDFESDGRRRDGKQADDNDREKRLRDAKYRDERVQRDHSGDRSDVKRLRSEGYTADLQYRKSSMHEGSPVYDDVARYKDDLGRRRRTNDKEDNGNNRSQNTKELRSDVEKRFTSNARVSFVTERGRSTSRNADLEPTPNNSRQRVSPTSRSHATRDYYSSRSKQEESKYRDYPFDERVRHGVSSRDHAGSAGATEKISSPRSTERLIQREDSFRGESSTERRLKSDVHNSPLHPSSASNERRHFSRSEVWRSIDGEEFAQRSGTPRDVREGRGSRELAGEALTGDELSFPDGDKVSISSPFSRGSHFSGRPKSVLPPPPLLRSGGDSPSIFGSSEDDNRGKSINHQRRVNDHNIGRMHGNAWKGVPNWLPPAVNGFMPFQHGPPPVGFHPMMQQFPMPPMFGVRPSMDLSHSGAPYHIPDAGRFAGDGRSMGWQTPIDDSCGPPMHGWAANSAIFGEEAHLYGRPDRDQTRTLSNSGRNWETSGDMWKGPLRGTSVELPSGSQKEDYSIQGARDDSLPGQLAQQAQSEQHKTASDTESNGIVQSSGDPRKNTPENMKINPQEQPVEMKSSKKDDTCLCHVYLSKLDISAELTEPELFDQCKRLIGVDKKMPSGVDSKILLLEGSVEAFVTRPSKLSSSPLVAAMTDSVFQKAMSLYQKGREDIKVMNGKKGSCPGQQGESSPALKLENFSSESGEKEAVVAGDVLAKDGDRGVDVLVSSEEAVRLLKSTSHELAEPPVVEMKEKSDLLSSGAKIVGMEGDAVPGVVQEHIVDEKPSSTEEVAVSDAPAPEMSGDLIRSNSLVGNCPVDVEVEDKFFDAKYGSLLIPDVSSEAVMPESIESSRIHHSLESTH